MADEDAQALIKKAVSDDVFRRSLASDFDAVVKAHHIKLSAEEAKALKKVDWKQPIPGFDPKKAATWVHIYKTDAVARPVRGK